MKIKSRVVITGFCVVALSSCSSLFEDKSYQSYESYNYDQPLTYPADSSKPTEQSKANQPGVAVPESYHVGATRAPAPHKSMDKNWVNSQNPMGYTIEVGDDEKPSNVAGRLQSTPSSDRKAEVKYQKGGKTYYKGLYGTYNSYQDAQKALDALPPDVKAGAKVKNWSSVQNGVNH